MILIIPKGNPIAFWKDGKKTFNQTELTNTTDTKFFQKWELTDNIRLQFRTNEPKELFIKLYNEITGVESAEIPLVQTDLGNDVYLHEVSFTFGEKGVADKDVVALRLYKREFISTAEIAMTAPVGTLMMNIMNNVVAFTAEIEMTAPTSSMEVEASTAVALASLVEYDFGAAWVMDFDDSYTSEELNDTDAGLLHPLKNSDVLVRVTCHDNVDQPGGIYPKVQWLINAVVDYEEVFTEPDMFQDHVFEDVKPGDVLLIKIVENV